ncbi:hypothetical protein C8035_v006373 [Colletotrichum spinosum]|uniref:F-box domain-containing protein n=1 Tax=Colletotrichum spinosum TaxID=1347390 RepID=A0A4R8QPQ9_9PEZI|nr:hypothetical protein C8035_v006373 [Colletotrichum spinosum]
MDPETTDLAIEAGGLRLSADHVQPPSMPIQAAEAIADDNDGADAIHNHQTSEARAEATKAVTDSDRVTASGNLKIRSKRTERLKKKMLKKRSKKTVSDATHVLHLPNEVLLSIATFLRPSDLFRLSRTCSVLYDLVWHNQTFLAREIIAARYSTIEKCFKLPVPLAEVDSSFHQPLKHPSRIEALAIHRRYRHIPVADHDLICTCLTCVLRWNGLCNVVDFSYWQTPLDKGEPMPAFPRNRDPKQEESDADETLNCPRKKPHLMSIPYTTSELTPGMHRTIVDNTNFIVSKALDSPLVHASILECHLKNTVAAIRRQASNKSNQRKHYPMTDAQAASETDDFLNTNGPSTPDLPFSRDNYDFLEVLMPARTWIKERQAWAYVPDELHERDLEWLAKRWTESSEKAS